MFRNLTAIYLQIWVVYVYIFQLLVSLPSIENIYVIFISQPGAKTVADIIVATSNS